MFFSGCSRLGILELFGLLGAVKGASGLSVALI